MHDARSVVRNTDVSRREAREALGYPLQLAQPSEPGTKDGPRPRNGPRLVHAPEVVQLAEKLGRLASERIEI